ncbi:MAG TPA: Holliday junction resolvase RuvX [Gammaproteobacteria bacterium]|nr:Holliday junction resolvase RuvX [Gammaproteobacteria bacterium]
MLPERILGFDFGIKRIGVAVGNGITQSTQSLTTLTAKQGKPDWKQLESIIREWHPEKMIVGVPQFDDNAHPTGQLALRFARQLEGRYGIPVETIDEYLSSVEAVSRMKTDPAKISQKMSLDAEAAQIILQTWLAEQMRQEL